MKMTTTSLAFQQYRNDFAARDPDLSRQRSADELQAITKADGLLELSMAPAPNVITGYPPKACDESLDCKYLWVVCTDTVPYALELGDNRNFLRRGYLSHTNLTGGEPAHAGGEMWFINSETLVFNGASSRYQPRSPQELDSLARAFKQCAYKVAHMGWDEGCGKPARILRGEPEWI